MSTSAELGALIAEWQKRLKTRPACNANGEQSLNLDYRSIVSSYLGTEDALPVVRWGSEDISHVSEAVAFNFTSLIRNLQKKCTEEGSIDASSWEAALQRAVFDGLKLAEEELQLLKLSGTYGLSLIRFLSNVTTMIPDLTHQQRERLFGIFKSLVSCENISLERISSHDLYYARQQTRFCTLLTTVIASMHDQKLKASEELFTLQNSPQARLLATRFASVDVAMKRVVYWLQHLNYGTLEIPASDVSSASETSAIIQSLSAAHEVFPISDSIVEALANVMKAQRPSRQAIEVASLWVPQMAERLICDVEKYYRSRGDENSKGHIYSIVEKLVQLSVVDDPYYNEPSLIAVERILTVIMSHAETHQDISILGPIWNQFFVRVVQDVTAVSSEVNDFTQIEILRHAILSRVSVPILRLLNCGIEGLVCPAYTRFDLNLIANNGMEYFVDSSCRLIERLRLILVAACGYPHLPEEMEIQPVGPPCQWEYRRTWVSNKKSVIDFVGRMMELICKANVPLHSRPILEALGIHTAGVAKSKAEESEHLFLDGLEVTSVRENSLACQNDWIFQTELMGPRFFERLMGLLDRQEKCRDENSIPSMITAGPEIVLQSADLCFLLLKLKHHPGNHGLITIKCIDELTATLLMYIRHTATSVVGIDDTNGIKAELGPSWASKSNLKRRRREAMEKSEQNLLKIISGLQMKKLVSESGLLIIRDSIDSEASQEVIFVSYKILRAALLSPATSMTLKQKLADFAMNEKRQTTPPGSKLELDLLREIVDFQIQGTEGIELKAENSERWRKFLGRVSDIIERRIGDIWNKAKELLLDRSGCPPAELSNGDLQVIRIIWLIQDVSSLSFDVLRIPGSNYDRSTMALEFLRHNVNFSIKLKPQGCDLPSMVELCVLTFPQAQNATSPVYSYSPQKVLLQALQTTWVDIRETVAWLCQKLLKLPSDLLPSVTGASTEVEDRWIAFFTFCDGLLRCQSVRDWEKGVELMRLVSHKLDNVYPIRVWAKFMEVSALPLTIDAETSALAQQSSSAIDWVRGLVLWMETFPRGDDNYCPQLQGYAKLLRVVISDYHIVAKECNVFESNREQWIEILSRIETIVMTGVDRMLQFIALGEDRILLSDTCEALRSGRQGDKMPQAVLGVDCRGHVIVRDSKSDLQGNDGCGNQENTNEPVLAHPTSFSNYWVAVKELGDLLNVCIKTLFAVNRKKMVADNVLCLGVSIMNVIFRSRHPGLLEAWAGALQTLVTQCATFDDSDSMDGGTTTKLSDIPAILIAVYFRALQPEVSITMPRCEEMRKSIVTELKHQLTSLEEEISTRLAVAEQRQTASKRWKDLNMLAREYAGAYMLSKLTDLDDEVSNTAKTLRVPSPLRKSACLTAGLMALIPQEFCVGGLGSSGVIVTAPNRYSKTRLALTSMDLCLFVASRLMSLASLELPPSSGLVDDLVRDTYATSKIHAINLLHSRLGRTPALFFNAEQLIECLPEDSRKTIPVWLNCIRPHCSRFRTAAGPLDHVNALNVEMFRLIRNTFAYPDYRIMGVSGGMFVSLLHSITGLANFARLAAHALDRAIDEPLDEMVMGCNCVNPGAHADKSFLLSIYSWQTSPDLRLCKMAPYRKAFLSGRNSISIDQLEEVYPAVFDEAKLTFQGFHEESRHMAHLTLCMLTFVRPDRHNVRFVEAMDVLKSLCIASENHFLQTACACILAHTNAGMDGQASLAKMICDPEVNISERYISALALLEMVAADRNVNVKWLEKDIDRFLDLVSAGDSRAMRLPLLCLLEHLQSSLSASSLLRLARTVVAVTQVSRGSHQLIAARMMVQLLFVHDVKDSTVTELLHQRVLLWINQNEKNQIRQEILRGIAFLVPSIVVDRAKLEFLMQCMSCFDQDHKTGWSIATDSRSALEACNLIAAVMKNYKVLDASVSQRLSRFAYRLAERFDRNVLMSLARMEIILYYMLVSETEVPESMERTLADTIDKFSDPMSDFNRRIKFMRILVNWAEKIDWDPLCERNDLARCQLSIWSKLPFYLTDEAIEVRLMGRAILRKIAKPETFVRDHTLGWLRSWAIMRPTVLRSRTSWDQSLDRFLLDHDAESFAPLERLHLTRSLMGPVFETDLLGALGLSLNNEQKVVFRSSPYFDEECHNLMHQDHDIVRVIAEASKAGVVFGCSADRGLRRLSLYKISISSKFDEKVENLFLQLVHSHWMSHDFVFMLSLLSKIVL